MPIRAGRAWYASSRPQKQPPAKVASCRPSGAVAGASSQAGLAVRAHDRMLPAFPCRAGGAGRMLRQKVCCHVVKHSRAATSWLSKSDIFCTKRVLTDFLKESLFSHLCQSAVIASETCLHHRKQSQPLLLLWRCCRLQTSDSESLPCTLAEHCTFPLPACVPPAGLQFQMGKHVSQGPAAQQVSSAGGI